MKQFVLIAFLLIGGCAALRPVTDVLLSDGSMDEQTVIELAQDRADFQAVLDNPNASEIDKKAASTAIRAIDAIPKGATSSPLIAEILAALGVPGALVAGVFIKVLKKRIKQSMDEWQAESSPDAPAGVETPALVRAKARLGVK